MARSKTQARGTAKAQAKANAKAKAQAESGADAEAKLKGSIGVRVPGARTTKPPPFKLEIDAALQRLGQVAGVPAAELERLLARASYLGVGPWTYLSNAIQATRETLWQGPLVERAAHSWLGHLISGEAKEYTRRPYSALPAPDVPVVKASGYTGDARAVVRQDFVFGGRGPDLFCLWRTGASTARVVRVRAPDQVEILGETVLEFVRKQLAELGLGEAPAPAPAATSALPGVWVIEAAPGAPAPTDLARIGGLPIGITARSWPRRRRRPMHHVLTVDLRHHPTFQPQGQRASRPGRPTSRGTGWPPAP